MISKASTVAEYLASVPVERREAIEAVRRTVLANLDPAIEEGMQYGMIGYYVPHSIYPAGYHCDPKQPLPFASLAAQKNHLALYLFCIYGSPSHESALREAWAKTGKKLDMGKSCIRFKKLDDVPLDVIGQTIARMTLQNHIATYEANLQQAGVNREARKSAVSRSAEKGKKAPAKGKAVKPIAKKSAEKKSAAKKPSAKAKKSAAKKGTGKTAKKATARR